MYQTRPGKGRNKDDLGPLAWGVCELGASRLSACMAVMGKRERECTGIIHRKPHGRDTELMLLTRFIIRTFYNLMTLFRGVVMLPIELILYLL